MGEFWASLLDRSDIIEFFHPESIIYVTLAFVLFYVGKISYDLTTPFKLNSELTDKDNKAIGLSFAGYLFALGIVLHGVLVADSNLINATSWKSYLTKELVSATLWGIGAIILLHIARVVNDKLMLHRFNINRELVEKHNVAVGLVEVGSLVASAFIIHAAFSGESANLREAIIGLLIAFFSGQFLFLVFSVAYQKVTRFDFHTEIEDQNVAAGLSLCLHLIAMGNMLGGFIRFSESLPGLLLWFVLSVFILLTLRFLVDKVILPESALDEEIARDKNWGASLVTGVVAISLSVLINAAFLA